MSNIKESLTDEQMDELISRVISNEASKEDEEMLIDQVMKEQERIKKSEATYNYLKGSIFTALAFIIITYLIGR